MMVLDGIKVIDITQFISGSRCTQILADMGADVVKVEPPQGDALRLIFSLISGVERNYSVFNRNKYGIALDWRHPEGMEIVQDLARMCDIFVHNLIPGTLEKNNLGYPDLKEINPKLIYIAISGFGSQGKNPERAAFDIIAQATSGQLWNNLDDLAPPSNYWADLVSGAYAAVAVLMALIHRMNTGRGQYIDISMQDVLYFNNYRAMIDRAMGPAMAHVEQVLGRKTRDVMNSPDRMPFYGFFRSLDGKVAIVALTPRQWKDLAETVNHPELATDERFSNIIAQIHHHQEAVSLIEEWTMKHTSQEIIRTLEAGKIPCGTAYSTEQVNEDENLIERGMLTSVHHESYGDIDVPGIPYRFSETPGAVRSAAPRLGEHNRFILGKWLGLSEDRIDGLYDKKVIV
ncbi:MAG TPA: CoA transferase [Desulfomonilia bacterium]|nr:CoA transferase [Desulfomonilia bacterium]